jgi:hypothetical protein
MTPVIRLDNRATTQEDARAGPPSINGKAGAATFSEAAAITARATGRGLKRIRDHLEMEMEVAGTAGYR